MRKLIAPLALTIAFFAGSVPAQAGIGYNPRYARSSSSRDFRNHSRREQLDRRADQIAERARELRRSGRLSGDHYERTIVKLRRINHAVNRDRSIDEDQFRREMDWLDRAEATMRAWSGSDRRQDRQWFRQHR
jgi:hypothetical protein